MVVDNPTFSFFRENSGTLATNGCLAGPGHGALVMELTSPSRQCSPPRQLKQTQNGDASAFKNWSQVLTQAFGGLREMKMREGVRI